MSRCHTCLEHYIAARFCQNADQTFYSRDFGYLCICRVFMYSPILGRLTLAGAPVNRAFIGSNLFSSVFCCLLTPRTTHCNPYLTYKPTLSQYSSYSTCPRRWSGGEINPSGDHPILSFKRFLRILIQGQWDKFRHQK